MPTPTAADLKLYYLTGATASQPLPTHTIGTGSTTTSLVPTTALTAPAGGVGWFITGALAGEPFHVMGPASGGAYPLSKALSSAPSAGDQFVFCAVGSNRSTTQILGQTVGGEQPEIAAVAGSTITGLSIHRAAAGLGEGTLTVAFTASGQTVKIKMGTEEYGEAVALSTATSEAKPVYNAAKNGFIEVTAVLASLPATDQTEPWTLAFPVGKFVPDYEGDETSEISGGKVRVRGIAAVNGNASGVMASLAVHLIPPAGTATTIATGSSLGLTAGTFDGTDASDWEAAGWVYNSTKGDLRPYTLSGNTFTCPAANWVVLTGNGSTAAAYGATITGATSGATAVVVASRAGYAICKSLTGTFQVGETAGALGTLSAVAVGFRGKTAVAWEAGDTIRPMAPVDLTIDPAPTEVITSETQLPPLTFSCPTESAKLAIGNLGAGGVAILWQVETIRDGEPAGNHLERMRFSWT
jgi:hypothetical protein